MTGLRVVLLKSARYAFLLSVLFCSGFYTLNAVAAVDINSASAAQIAEGLKGVGLKKAEAIVAQRQKIGGFKQASDLLQVKGIGQKLLDSNKGNYIIKPLKTSLRTSVNRN